MFLVVDFYYFSYSCFSPSKNNVNSNLLFGFLRFPVFSILCIAKSNFLHILSFIRAFRTTYQLVDVALVLLFFSVIGSKSFHIFYLPVSWYNASNVVSLFFLEKPWNGIQPFLCVSFIIYYLIDNKCPI